jgi:RNA polymerase sigma-70 factor (ECF subfamily)
MITEFQKPRRYFAMLLLFTSLAVLMLVDAQEAQPPSDQWDSQKQVEMAEAGDKWAAYGLWDAYANGKYGVERDPAKADKWIHEFARDQDIWVVRFKTVGNFRPATTSQFYATIEAYTQVGGGKWDIGVASFFRTTKHGERLEGSFLSIHPDRLKASLAKVPGLEVYSTEHIGPEQFIEYNATLNESLVPNGVAAPAPPKIVSTSPKIGAKDVDPDLKEITVTFDQDMGRGMSWTGGGPDFPAMPKDQRAKWRNKRTCALPVKLEPGHYYRVGINSTSYLNFRSQSGMSAMPSAIYFTTSGASDDLKAKTAAPAIVSFNPSNGAQDVSPDLSEVRVTFNQPMGAGCSWCTAGDDDHDFPKGPEGKNFYWTDDKKTCVLPVALKPGMIYRIHLNDPQFKNFQSEAGVPLAPVAYSFKTAN